MYLPSLQTKTTWSTCPLLGGILPLGFAQIFDICRCRGLEPRDFFCSFAQKGIPGTPKDWGLFWEGTNPKLNKQTTNKQKHIQKHEPAYIDIFICHMYILKYLYAPNPLYTFTNTMVYSTIPNPM